MSGSTRDERGPVFMQFRDRVIRIGLILVGAFLSSGHLALAAEPWTEPVHWAAVGSVNTWLDIDIRLNNGRWEKADLTVSSEKQIDYYERTLTDTGALPRIDLATYRNLSEADRDQRRKQARKELALVIRWHQKQQSNANGLKVISWRGKQTNVDVLAAILESLNNATGIDPTNPYAWHLLGWLRAQVGDIERSNLALEMAIEALGLVPDEELPDLRRRLALDRAWNFRDLGRADLAETQIDQAEEYGGADFESDLLHGLLAAGQGNMAMAEHYARRVKNLGRFGREHGRDLHRQSRELLNRNGPAMVSSWILALTWLELGYPEEADSVFPDWGLIKRRPTPLAPFGNRFWRDAGTIYYLTGRENLARLAWFRGLCFTPYRPFFVYRAYAAPAGDVAGLTQDLRFQLNFGQFPGGGSRFAYALTLARTSASSPNAGAETALLAQAEEQLFICLRTGEFRPQAYLILEDLFRRVGQIPQADNCRLQAVQAFEHSGYVVAPGESGEALRLTGRKPRDLRQTILRDPVSGREVVWTDERSVPAVLAEIQDTYFADPNPKNRRALARFLIRNLHVAEGRDLLLNGIGTHPGAGTDVATLGSEDLVVLLEADRQDGIDTTARFLSDSLLSGDASQWTDSEVWALTGTTLMDMGDRTAGLAALRRALELDPENGGLQMQLRLLSH